MPLLEFWASSPDAVDQLSIEQIVASAGDGVLKDQSNCCDEFREYLTQAPTPKLAEYVDQCLASSFPKGGLVLQDLANELGRRLDYEVKNGRYQGVSGAIGFDGIWIAPEGQGVVVEVKTTDAYRMPLDTIAGYRRKLIESGAIGLDSSILIVVGRQETGELEAQIRGSRHAWDIRLISTESLLRLVLLRENAETTSVGMKIRGLLRPVEYTRLDQLVDVMFDAVADVETPPEESFDDQEGQPQTKKPGSAQSSSWQFTDSNQLQAKRLLVIGALAKRESAELTRKSRALYISPDLEVRAACGMSKRYSGKNPNVYWYAFHPEWDSFLKGGTRSFFVLGCMDKDEAYAIPHKVIKSMLSSLNTTTKDGSTYWHIHLREDDDTTYLVIPKGQPFDLSPFAFKLG
jgi:hypothetical protein